MKNTKLQTLQKLLLATISVLSFAAFSIAQTETARIQGTVSDANGATVAGATVTVTDSGTGRQVKVTSNSDGTYSVLSLKPGKYQIEVGAANFKTVKQDINARSRAKCKPRLRTRSRRGLRNRYGN